MLAALVALLFLPDALAFNPRQLQSMGAQGVNLWKLEQSSASASADPSTNAFDAPVQRPYRAGDVSDTAKEFPAQWFMQPLDHFAKGHHHLWEQRYWVNKRHYKKGGPVIVLDGGETSGENRLPFLDTGIVEILAKATNGLGVVLEHRYYGTSPTLFEAHVELNQYYRRIYPSI